jgi:hypothetical protein
MNEKYDHEEALEQLIAFMNFKSSIIDSLNVEYFSTKDEIQLRKLSKTRLKIAYLCVKHGVIVNILQETSNIILPNNRKFNLPVDSTICPFCNIFFHIDSYNINESCPKCPYKKNHGCCILDDSGYSDILDHIIRISEHSIDNITDLLLKDESTNDRVREIFKL